MPCYYIDIRKLTSIKGSKQGCDATPHPYKDQARPARVVGSNTARDAPDVVSKRLHDVVYNHHKGWKDPAPQYFQGPLDDHAPLTWNYCDVAGIHNVGKSADYHSGTGSKSNDCADLDTGLNIAESTTVPPLIYIVAWPDEGVD